MKTVMLLAGLALVVGCHCPREIEPIVPRDTCLTADIASEVKLSRRGCVGDPATFVVENAIWLPYKVASGPLAGAYQGVWGAYSAGGDPVTGTLIAPFGLILGTAIGTFNGLFQQPDVIEANDNLADALAYPFTTDQEIWKTSTPPSGTFYRRKEVAPEGAWPPREEEKER